jgi:hypothetical protein
MQKVGDIVNKYKFEDTDKYVSREFQKYAYELSEELGDSTHRSLYMKLVKETSRGLVESARGFVKDAAYARSKPRLFMWRLKQLKDEVKNKKDATI